MSDTPPLTCANHPGVATSLRCNRCNKPICVKCAGLTPTGYRCKECVRGQQKVFETAQNFDFPVAFIISAVLAFAGSLVLSYIGFLTFFVGPLIGGVAAELVRTAVRKRRSKPLFLTAAAGAAAGCAWVLLNAVLNFTLFGMFWAGLYSFLVVSTVYYRLHGGIRV
ncbi:MAG: hypothetical protein ACOYYS_04175 [Chloroflexota bacterium]